MVDVMALFTDDPGQLFDPFPCIVEVDIPLLNEESDFLTNERSGYRVALAQDLDDTASTDPHFPLDAGCQAALSAQK